MNRTLILSTIALLVVSVSLAYFVWFRPSQAETEKPKETAEKSKTAANVIAAPGVVEAVSEETEVSAGIGGKLKEVTVEEGDTVVRNQIIAVLENADFAAQVMSAKAEIETLKSQRETAKARLIQAKAEKLRIINGSRQEERKEALAGYEQTNAVLENAKREAARRKILFENGDIAREEYERSARDLAVASKRSAEMGERFNVVNAPARSDDLERADAAILLAQSQFAEFEALIAAAKTKIAETEARLAKTVVRAPFSGIILRKRLKAGESFSPENSANGIVTIGDVSALRVRVDLDETDVAKIREEQRAYVTAAAYGKQQFTAKVIKIGQILGRKNVRSEEPTEKVDKKILEVLLELDPNQRLPVGLRVDVFIQTE
ncbi:MAG: efflux RND transporter periplasmic adaptor subunit [Pyrinomonadaceae bacterium]